MPEDKPTIGPMRTQPLDRGSIVATPVQPMMPTAGATKAGSNKAPKAKRSPTRAEAVDAAKARMSRRKSLLRQRQALKE
jgi:hypothetical protein